MKYDNLAKLDELRRNGTISEEEYAREKEKILNTPDPEPIFSNEGGKIFGFEPHTYCMLMHLSQFLSGSGIGIVAPIVMWAIGKDKIRMIDDQGKIIINWYISAFIYGAISGALLFVFFIGLIPLMILAVLVIVFPIIGAVKANNGETWKYPLSIPFLAVNQSY